MSETVRTMVVKMSMDAGGFRKTASDIKTQIRNVDKELRGLGSSTDGRMQLLNEKLTLQKGAVQNFQGAVDVARANLDKAETAADKLLAAKRLSTLETDLNNAKEAARLLEEQIRHAKWDNLSELGRKAQNVGRKMSLYITAPLAALGGKSYSVFKQQEDAFVSMQKTVDETDTTNYDQLSESLYELSETIPASYEELMALAQTAGAMGVTADEIEKVVETTARLSVSLDGIDGVTAAQQMAQILNITEGGPDNIDSFGAALVALGNNFPTLEGEILNFADRVKTSGALVGMTTAEIIGLSAGFTAMGIKAEAGGGAVSRVLQEMQKAVELGGNGIKFLTDAWGGEDGSLNLRAIQINAEDGEWVKAMAEDLKVTKKELREMIDNAVAFENFASLMGMDTGGFAASWDASAADSMLAFFQGLSNLNMDDAGESVVSWLSKMDLDNIRIAQILQGASLNPEMMARAMSLSTEEYANGVALLEESNKKFSTTLSQDEIRMNRTENAMADYGENIAELLEPVKSAFDDLLKKFAALDEDTQKWIVQLGAGLAATGPAMVGVGKLVESLGGGAKFIGDLVSGSTKLGDSALFKYAKVGTTLWILWKLMEGAATTLLDNPLAENNLVWVEEEIASAEELTPALQKAADELERYHLALQAVSDPALQTTDYEAARKLLEPIFTQDIRDELFGGLEMESLIGPGSNVAFYLNEYKSYIEQQMAELITQNDTAGADAGEAVTEGMTVAIDAGKGNVEGALAAMEGGLVEQARAMAQAISDAFNENVHFKVPGVDGPGSTTNVNVSATPGARDIYNIKRALTTSALRDARGYGKT